MNPLKDTEKRDLETVYMKTRRILAKLGFGCWEYNDNIYG